MKIKNDDLEISIWKQSQRKTADEHLSVIFNHNLTPEQRTSALNSLTVCVSNINDPAVTKFYGGALSSQKIITQKDFVDKVQKITLEPVLASKEKLESVNCNHIASKILSQYKIIYLNNDFYIYEGGVYKKVFEKKIESIIKQTVNDHFSSFIAKEVKLALSAETYKSSEDVNQYKTLLNVRNGMLDLLTWELKRHDPSYLSTIQITCDFAPEAKCSKWINFLGQMFGDDPFKVDILQEFFGYCLTPLTNQEKVVLMVGEGANGKSKVLDVLEGLLGLDNTSAVPFEQFKNSHYLANFFGSMVNISYETNTKTQVYEATFKQLVSGETITADRKYGHPFKFKNTCKLIFAFNTMPYIDDTTDAFYRRILPIPCNVQIPEDEQNKNLSQELLEERSGILNWALHGLRRLQQQDKFSNSPSVKSLIDEYRKDNNNVISFVDESCELDPEAHSTKEELYRSYKKFCEENGFSPLAIRKFGKRLKKYCRAVFDNSGTDNIKIWVGIKAK